MGARVGDGQYASLPYGIRLHYASAGERGAPLMLFVHGFPEAWFEWERQLEYFGSTHFAVACDLRGFNLSSKPAAVEAYRARLLVQDLTDLMDALGYRDAVVVAHDWGGAVAWNLALYQPERVRRLVIINSPHPYLFARALATDRAQQEASAYMNWLRRPGSETVLAENDFARMDAMFADAQGNMPAWYTPALRARYHAMWSTPGEAGSHSLTGGVNYYRATPLHPPAPGEAPPDVSALAGKDWRIALPVTVIWGLADRALRPILVEGLSDWCPNATITPIPEAGHWVVHEQPERVNALIAASL